LPLLACIQYISKAYSVEKQVINKAILYHYKYFVIKFFNTIKSKSSMSARPKKQRGARKPCRVEALFFLDFLWLLTHKAGSKHALCPVSRQESDQKPTESLLLIAALKYQLA
jgi:hypothetical protein